MRNAFGQPQTVLVLGGTSEIAHHVVLQLVRERTTTVVLAGRDKGRLEDAASELREAGATTVWSSSRLDNSAIKTFLTMIPWQPSNSLT